MSFTGEFVEVETGDEVELIGLKSEAESDTIILHLHGMQGNFFQNGFTQEMIERYPENGYSFLTVELRGAEAVRFFPKEEELVSMGNAYERFSESVMDIAAWLGYAKQLGYSNIVLQGHSLGAVKAANFLATQEHGVDAAVFISPPDMYGSFSAAEDYSETMEEAREAVEEGEADRIVTEDFLGWAYLSAGTFLDLCTENSDADLFSFHSGKLERWESIQVPSLATMGSSDSAVVKPEQECLEMLEENFKGERLETELFEGSEHDYAGFEAELAERAIEFLNSLE